MSKKEKLFIFDVGGVLVKLDPLSRDKAISHGAVSGSAARYGEALESVLKDFRLGLSTETDYVQAMSEIFKVPPRSIYDAEHAYVAEGYSEFIEFVRKLCTKHRVICLSNNQPIHWRYITDHLLGPDYFDHAYLSHEMGLEKPDQAIFHAVSKAEQCEDRQVIFIDDTEENVEAARLIGWQHCIFHKDAEETTRELLALAAV